MTTEKCQFIVPAGHEIRLFSFVYMYREYVPVCLSFKSSVTTTFPSFLLACVFCRGVATCVYIFHEQSAMKLHISRVTRNVSFFLHLYV